MKYRVWNIHRTELRETLARVHRGDLETPPIHTFINVVNWTGDFELAGISEIEFWGGFDEVVKAIVFEARYLGLFPELPELSQSRRDLILLSFRHRYGDYLKMTRREILSMDRNRRLLFARGGGCAL